MLRFYQITDLHYYPARELKASGKAWEKRALYDQRCVAESEAIVDAALEYIAGNSEIGIVLITGDVVCDGELAGHLSLAKKLEKLKSAGKRIFLITASHDIRPDPKGYSEEKGEYIVECATKEQLFDIYYDFGLNEALSIHKPTSSYCVQLEKGYRLIMLNDDREGWGADSYGFSEEQLQWAKDQINAAHKAGDEMLAVCHHPLLSPVKFYRSFSPHEMIDDCDKVAGFLADNGVRVLFTGHTHMQNINYYDSPQGNRLYEINTGCLTAYPSPIREISLNGNTLEVVTRHLDRINYDIQCKPYMTYLQEHFDFMLHDIFYSAAHDIDRFCELGESFSLKKEQAEKLKVPINLAGKILESLTFKKAGRLLGVLHKIAPRMYDVRLCDFLITLVNNVYGGTRDYAPGSAEYDSFMALADRGVSLLPVKNLKQKYNEKIRPILSDILFNANGIDSNNAVIYI